MKVFIMKNKTLRSMKFKDLWPWVLSKFSDTYEVVCRLVVFMLLFVLDNSEMELAPVLVDEQDRAPQQLPDCAPQQLPEGKN